MFIKCRLLTSPRPTPGLRLAYPNQWNRSLILKCNIHYDGRSRVSNFWIPTGGIERKAAETVKEDANDLLIRAGFIRQAYSGIFHMLPLGLRVQNKLEALIDRHMESLGASKVSLSSLSSQELWEKTGRLKSGSEVFKFNDRKESRFLLAPTHEEEITSLVASLVNSYKELPLRLYQITRKYRDEARPRQGLLRGREFVMKDLYTFDYNAEQALATYEATREAYKRIFDTLKVPYLVAAADSGNMGGNLSHEFHFISDKGEDTLISCSHCDYVYNEEVSDGRALGTVIEKPLTPPVPSESGVGTDNPLAISVALWTAISKDKKTLVRAWYPRYSTPDLGSEPREREVNSHAIKAIAKSTGIDLDTGVESPVALWYIDLKKTTASGFQMESTSAYKILDIYDSQVAPYSRPPLSGLPENFDKVKYPVEFALLNRFPGTKDGLSLTRVLDGDKCHKCSEGSLHMHNAVELGHTFYLGTRYSEVLKAKVFVDNSVIKSNESSTNSNKSQNVPMEMGCHGIGVSRMISAVADARSDIRGLNWPRAIAPFEIIVVPARNLEPEAENIYDLLRQHTDTSDIILDDRTKQVGWKLKDADLIGYPIVIVLGKAWKSEHKVEVHCRQLDGLREDVPLGNLVEYVRSLLARL
ncbi:prolyl-tRNA synthetase [Talaromyces stipitatus ATCC 10500]|uniref:proline--tRNA ligase n=1 Tax=Talaromyces stipitatus (strain ATCC 10500 / CBS 375.48 / QM 6759 / NRRL 1006) TaxID=441959 RepID=B8LW90_TALSN|nr:prolyl-tRNA synthetase [Talaromyces stipitatus ATCC 10500]EED24118.1 prolyl-tRNA synthetase [Talaromyces stipitatus ATCC 10500]